MTFSESTTKNITMPKLQIMKQQFFCVPNSPRFSCFYRFLGSQYEVPESQLNIISTFQNIHTGKILQFRNECRFSHGQFNGTPEAKMYATRTTNLTDLYEPLE